MIFPVGDDQIKGGNLPIFSYLFLAINIGIFIYQVSLSDTLLESFVYHYGTIPTEIVNGVDLFTLLTNMFLHGGFMHLIGNMLFLFVFADNIEAIIGNFKFLLFYLAGGILASLAHVYMNTSSAIPSLGASGAISAVLGAYLVMFPSSKVKVLVIYLFRTFSIAAYLFLGFWIVQNFLSGFASLGPESANTGGTAWWAHIGGFVFGALCGLVFKKNYPPDRMIEDTVNNPLLQDRAMIVEKRPHYSGVYPKYL